MSANYFLNSLPIELRKIIEDSGCRGRVFCQERVTLEKV